MSYFNTQTKRKRRSVPHKKQKTTTRVPGQCCCYPFGAAQHSCTHPAAPHPLSSKRPDRRSFDCYMYKKPLAQFQRASRTGTQQDRPLVIKAGGSRAADDTIPRSTIFLSTARRAPRQVQTTCIICVNISLLCNNSVTALLNEANTDTHVAIVVPKHRRAKSPQQFGQKVEKERIMFRESALHNALDSTTIAPTAPHCGKHALFCPASF